MTSEGRYTDTELIKLSRNDDSIDLIDQLLPDTGYMVIGAEHGVGKTWEALHLLYSFASKSNSDYHGLKTKNVHAIYINLEDSEVKLGSRLDIIKPLYNLDYEPIIYSLPNMYIDTPEGEKTLRHIIEHSRANGYPTKAIIIDSFKYAISGDYTKSNITKKWTDLVKKLSKEYKIAFIFLHHLRKMVAYQNKFEDLISSDRLKGAKDLIDHAEACVLIAVNNKSIWDSGKTRREKTTVLAVTKQRHAVVDLECNPLVIEFNRSTCMWNGQKWEVDDHDLIIMEQE